MKQPEIGADRRQRCAPDEADRQTPQLVRRPGDNGAAARTAQRRSNPSHPPSPTSPRPEVPSPSGRGLGLQSEVPVRGFPEPRPRFSTHGSPACGPRFPGVRPRPRRAGEKSGSDMGRAVRVERQQGHGDGTGRGHVSVDYQRLYWTADIWTWGINRPDVQLSRPAASGISKAPGHSETGSQSIDLHLGG